MSDRTVRLPSRIEAVSSCILCARPPARVLSFKDRECGSVTRLCGLHYEDLQRQITSSFLTYEERKAHGMVDALTKEDTKWVRR